MSQILLIIEDKVRDERVRVGLDNNHQVQAIIQDLVEMFGLPRRNFDLSHIEYQLVRSADRKQLHGSMTLSEAGVKEGELLELDSPEGRLVWSAIQKLLDEIESEIIDRVTGKYKDRVIEEVWDRVTRKLNQIEKAQTGGDRVERLRQWVDRMGGPAKLVEDIGKAADAAELYRSTTTARDSAEKVSTAGRSLLLIGGAGVGALLLGGLILILLFANPPPSPPPAPLPPDEVSPAQPQVETREPPIQSPPTSTDPDLDEDGLVNSREQEFGTDPLNPDTDGDEISDGEEIFSYDTDPLNPDTDDDDLFDGEELFDYGTDPLNPDSDGDGLSDSQEIFEFGTDPLNPDSDGDRLWDWDGEFVWVGEEYGENADPLNPDTDGDGYPDGDEMYELGSNPLDPEDPASGENPLSNDPGAVDRDGEGSSDAGEDDTETNPMDPDVKEDEPQGEGESFFNQGMALLEQGAFEAAVDEFNQAQEWGWETAELFYARALACQQLEFDYFACSPEQAIDDYSRAIDLNPGEIWAYINRGNIYYTVLGDDDQGLRDLDSAVEIAPGDPNPYFHRGIYFLHHEEWDALIGDMTQAIPLAPEWPDLYGHRGFGYQQLGMIDEARQDYEVFMELASGDPIYDEWVSYVQGWLEEH